MILPGYCTTNYMRQICEIEKIYNQCGRDLYVG